MPALASDKLTRKWLSDGLRARSVAAGQLAANQTVYLGAVAMSVDGVVRPVVSGSALLQLGSEVGGGGANNSIYLRALTQAVKAELADPGSNNAHEHVDVNFAEGEVRISIFLATDGMGGITSTASSVVQSLRRHGLASQLVVAEAKGNGSGVLPAVSLTPVKHLEVLGVACRRLVSKSTAIPLTPSDEFLTGVYGLSATGGVTGGMVAILNDQEVGRPTNGFDFVLPAVSVRDGVAYCDLDRCR